MSFEARIGNLLNLVDIYKYFIVNSRNICQIYKIDFKFHYLISIDIFHSFIKF
jgi:hypothetical protein